MILELLRKTLIFDIKWALFIWHICGFDNALREAVVDSQFLKNAVAIKIA